MKTERSACANTEPTSQVSHDARGNLIQITDALGHVNTFSFDRNNRITQETLPLGQSTRCRYDGAGKLTQTTSPDGHTTGYTWDAEDHLTAWTDTDHSRSQSTSTQLSYDAAGRKTGETIIYPGISGNASITGAGAGSTLGYSMA